MASNLHFSKQVMHLMHFSLSMRATSFFFQVMASTGQLRKQRPHLVHSSGSTSNLNNSMQRLAGHFFSNTCASYSSLKYLKVERTGLGPVCPNPQRDASFMVFESSSSVSISSGFPGPHRFFPVIATGAASLRDRVCICRRIHPARNP